MGSKWSPWERAAVTLTVVLATIAYAQVAWKIIEATS